MTCSGMVTLDAASGVAAASSAPSPLSAERAGREQHDHRDGGQGHHAADRDLHPLTARGTRLLGLLLRLALLATALLLILTV